MVNKLSKKLVTKYTEQELELLGAILTHYYGTEHSIEDVQAFLSPTSLHNISANAEGLAFYKDGSIHDGFTELDIVRRKCLEAPLEEMPLLINSVLNTAKIISKWRLSIGK